MPTYITPKLLPLSFVLTCAACSSSVDADVRRSEDPATGSDAAMLAGDDAGASESHDAATPAGDRDADGPVLPCDADGHEPDDSLGKAMQHDALSGIQPVQVDTQVACGRDADVLWAFADAGGRAGATLTWDASQGELTLSMLASDGTEISTFDLSELAAGKAQLGIQAYYGQHFFVRVHNPGRGPVPYSLTLNAMVFGP